MGNNKINRQYFIGSHDKKDNKINIHDYAPPFNTIEETQASIKNHGFGELQDVVIIEKEVNTDNGRVYNSIAKVIKGSKDPFMEIIEKANEQENDLMEKIQDIINEKDDIQRVLKFSKLNLNKHIQFVDAQSGYPIISHEGMQIIETILRTGDQDLIGQLTRAYIMIHEEKKSKEDDDVPGMSGGKINDMSSYLDNSPLFDQNMIDHALYELNTLVARQTETEALDQFSSNIFFEFKKQNNPSHFEISATEQGMQIIKQIFNENDLIVINALAQRAIEQMRVQYLKKYDLEKTNDFPINSQNIKSAIDSLKQLLDVEKES